MVSSIPDGHATIPSDHEFTEAELHAIVRLICGAGVGWVMGAADYAMIRCLGGRHVVGGAGLRRLIANAADYLWDRVLGEPSSVTIAQLEQRFSTIIHEWWKDR